MVKVIFREEYNPYVETDGFIAIFPEDEANPRRVGTIGFYFLGSLSTGLRPVFEPYGEADIEYVLKKKIIHKNDDRIPMLVEAIERRIDDKVQVVEKMR